MEKIIIAAVADDNAIGKDNALLWHISEDLKYFKRTTLGSPVIMGYKTWLSIGRPLPGRLNIVITREPFEVPEGSGVSRGGVEGVVPMSAGASGVPAGVAGGSGAVGSGGVVGAQGALSGGTGLVQVRTVQEALEVAENYKLAKVFIMGGAKTYERTMDLADALYITHVRTCVPDADAFFPAIDPAVWEKVSETDYQADPKCGLEYSFAVYRRR